MRSLPLLLSTMAATALFAPPLRAQAAHEPVLEPEVQPVLLTRDLPRLTNRAYPASLRAHPLPGSADVRMKIMENGRVDTASISIVVSSAPEFELPALQVARQLRFKPARLGGIPVPVWVTFPIHFLATTDGTSTITQKYRL